MAAAAAAAAAAARSRRNLLVHYVHGLESGPNGFKARVLRKDFEVAAPDMEMSLWNPFKQHSAARNVLRRMVSLQSVAIEGALQDSFQQCIEVQKNALPTAGKQEQEVVLVGSSWGGAVACALVALDLFRGPAGKFRARESCL